MTNSDALVSRERLLSHAVDYRRHAKELAEMPERWLTGDREERVRENKALASYFYRLARGASR